MNVSTLLLSSDTPEEGIGDAEEGLPSQRQRVGRRGKSAVRQEGRQHLGCKLKK